MSDPNNNITTPQSPHTLDCINAQEWDEYTLSELYDQLSVLQNRVTVAQQMSKSGIAIQIQQGIDNIQYIITNKSIGETVT